MGASLSTSSSNTPSATTREAEELEEHIAVVRQFIDKLPGTLYIDGPRVMRETGFPVGEVGGGDPDRPPRANEATRLAEAFSRKSALGWYVHRGGFKGVTTLLQILHPCPHHPGWNPDQPDTPGSFFITAPPADAARVADLADRDYPGITHVKLRAYRERDGPGGHECERYRDARWTVSLAEYLAVESNHRG